VNVCEFSLVDFDSCWGLEILSGLSDISTSVLSKWEKIKNSRNQRKQDCMVRFLCDDVTAPELNWSDADVVIMHVTRFDDILMNKITRIAEGMTSGSFLISLSKK
jgi:hypothetical protein